MNTMKRHLTKVLFATGAVALVAAGCSSGSNGGGSAAANPGSSAFVSVATVSGSRVLVDSAGNTLYSPTNEQGGHIHCVGACTSFWKPLSASSTQAQAAKAQVGSSVGTVRRPDGTMQLTYHGRPLYSFSEEGPGQLTGNGFRDAFNGTQFDWAAVGVHGSVAHPKGAAGSGGGYSSSQQGGSGYQY
jgi:predicted lipoprotein with Yx(FWY)xxD motif